MDISRTPQKKPKYTQFLIWALVFIVVASAIYYLWYLAQASFSIDSNQIVTDSVKRGEFSVSVRGSGILVPRDIQWLSSNVEARVEKVIVKAGKSVKKGELIVKLSNPQLEQLLEETKWELEAKIAESEAAKVEQEALLLDQKSLMLDAKLNYESSKLKQDAQEQLYQSGSGVISKIDYEKTRLETIQLGQRLELQSARLEKVKQNIIVQSNARQARLNKMTKTLERAQQQVDSLMVVATLDSVVQEVPVEAGQRVNMGGNIAKLARKNDLIAELKIPEIQIRDVAIGQKVIIDTRNNKVFGTVSRVDPAVVNGSVQVDVSFTDNLPSDARPDLTVDGEIKISYIANTLFIDRPLFAQSQSTSSLYKVSSDGRFAEQVTVMLGKGSINQIEILNGLDVGETIIVSDPSIWQTHKKIRIN
ncbi:efflux RND transporter periplasmic adaptor subunit [Pseudoalteromonas sp. C2R02]|uniref:HlyD family secretion protein n=1 Tax=Pseudoalteromonas sp. C2R02 TaxID=2841565 RepID=UPI001C090F5A|nr:HlyD family efflux transporter periplasmic adaptor subunit [Pseudoalteromonas sp. C2R02]MBU2972397.1 efflux RND transporter periplasmic adaptor subunit [Pseudoalteromonas sp. C2R02]